MSVWGTILEGTKKECISQEKWITYCIERTLCYSVISLLLVPNIFIYSIDDIIEINWPDPLRFIGFDQASNGRYVFSFICHFLHAVGMRRIDLESIGALSIIVGFFELYKASLSYSRIKLSIFESIIGFSIFVTFGLLMDVFSFATVWIQSGIAAICAAFVLMVSDKSNPTSVKITAAAALGWIGMGVYQTYAYMVACSLVCSCFITLLTQKHESIFSLLKRHIPPILGTFLAILLYFLSNKILHICQVPGFLQESRVHGLQFIIPNFHSCIQTIFEALNAFDGPYAHYESRISLIISLLGALTLLIMCRSWIRILIAIFILIVGFSMLPNPTNILMKVYWPSPRSLSPVALSMALIMVAGVSRLRRTLHSAHLGLFLIGASACSQAIIYIDQQKGRADQELADFVTVSTLVNRAYADFPVEVRPLIKMNLDWRDNTINRVHTYEFGSTLLNSPVHQQALIAYLSAGRVDSAPASIEDCAGASGRMSVEKRGNALLVCAKR